MIDDHLLMQVQKNSDDIALLRERVYNIDKNQSGLEINIGYLSDNIAKLTISVDKFRDEQKEMHEKITPMQSYMQNNKGVVQFFSENWVKIPATLAMLGSLYYGITYVNKYFLLV